MRSRAHYLKGHPIHPVLVPFPLALLLATVAFDGIGVVLDAPGWYIAGKYMAGVGVGMGVLAAVPGLVDYAYTVPPRSSARRAATRHMLANIAALLIFGVSFWIRGGAGVPPDPPILWLELIGAACLVYSGFLGGTLVFRNQIGVDHRYAGAGKWRETAVERTPVTVARADELEPGQMKLVRVGRRRVVLARTADGYVAFDDHCTHRGGSLAGGILACDVVTCPWHGSQFRVGTGEVVSGPAREPVATYRIEVVGDEVRLIL
ncbi:MAG TPA: DUF2231 domain-containing protein [Longimicrobiales bacterium]|nr:DUF2231 domain-containing protein [Longimicrobiales bacterium]